MIVALTGHSHWPFGAFSIALCVLRITNMTRLLTLSVCMPTAMSENRI